MNSTRLLSAVSVLAILMPLSAQAFTADTFRNILDPSSVSSSSVSQTDHSLATQATFNRQRGRDIASASSTSTSTFVPFLKRFFTLPAGWKGVLGKSGDDDIVTFAKAATGTGSTQTITIQLFAYKDCDKNSIEDSREKLWKNAGKLTEGTIGIARAYGATGLGLTWLEPSPAGTLRQFCAVPAGHVLTAKVTVLASDTLSATLVERQILAQIWRSDRFGRGR